MMNSFRLGSVAFTLLLGSLTLLSGCATPARTDQMVASQPSVPRAPVPTALRESIGIRDVTGGRDTNPLWVSNVGSVEFERALEDSLRNAGLLAPVRGAARYQLSADLHKLDQPLMGLDMTVTATVDWHLVERATGRNILKRSIGTPYTAKMSDAFLGMERMKLANEGAIRRSIEVLIEEILRLPVDAASPPK
jgi:hypothetical protein